MKNKLFSLITVFIFSCFFCFSQETELTTIKIENSMQTTYKKDEKSGENLIVLEGAVEISVKKGSNTSVIKADKVTYNRENEMLFAEGNVEIYTEGASAGGEKTTANSLLMNTSTLEGVFDGGRVVQTKSDALNLPSGSTLIVFSDLFGKSQSNTISFKNSKLTFCDDENPHWHIDSTRTWLLPGGEFAFFNALLYVGPVPVIYLPAFYYPKDELIFNPVFSKSARKGYTVQNTFYLIGRKPLDTSSSSSTDEETTSSAEALKGLYNFMKPTTLKEQERQGLILHNLDENYSGTTSKYLKILADYYSNLGYLVGIDGAFQPKDKLITNLKFNLDLGFSKTLFPNNNNYSFVSKNEKVYWDKSNFMGLKTPFRYGANLDLSITKPFKISLSMPFYTDPYFYYDFKERQESMDWISYFLQGEDSSTTQSEYSSFTWKLSNQYSPKLPSFFKPYISSLSLKLDSSINFGTANAKFQDNGVYNDDRAKEGDSWEYYTPERRFYYPSEITPATASITMSGTLFQWPVTSTEKKSEKINYSIPLSMPDELKSASVIAKEKEAQENAKNDDSEKEVEDETETLTKTDSPSETEVLSPETTIESLFTQLPDFQTSTSSVTVPTGLTYSLGYSIAPNITTKFTYSPYEPNEAGTSTIQYLNTQEDFDWSKIKSYMYTYKMPTTITSNLKYGGNFLSMTNKFSWDLVLQDHPNTDGVIMSEKKSLALADKKAQSQTISNSNTISFKPFSYIPMFADTGVSWNTTLKLYRKDFKGTSSDSDWEEYWKTSDAWESYWLHDYWDDSNWTTENKKNTFQRKIITTNTVNLSLGANELNSKYKQNLTWAMTLPPQLEKHSLSLNLTFPYVSNSFSWGFQKNEAADKSTDSNTNPDGNIKISKYDYNNFTQALSANILNSTFRLSESCSIVTDSNTLKETNRSGINILDSLKFSLSWKKITASYIMSYTQGYDLVDGQGWVEKKDDEGKAYKSFIPYSLSFSWSPEIKTYYRWAKKISFAPGLSTSIIADLIRPTNSTFTFSPSLNFKINDIFDISFSATSKNSTLYWYFQKNGIYSDCGDWFLPMMFVDLLRSFGIGIGDASQGSFTKNREKSGFKIKSLNMTASHDIHDWKFNMTWKIEPKLVRKGNKYEYNFDPYISIGVVWKPMESMKTTVVHEYDKTKGDTIWELNP